MIEEDRFLNSTVFLLDDCNFIKEKCIKNELKEEIEEILNNYELIESIMSNGIRKSIFIKDCNKLQLELTPNYISILKKMGDTLAEKIVIDDKLNIKKRTIERREAGVLVKDITKRFSKSTKYKNKNVLTDLTESRYILTNKTVSPIFKYIGCVGGATLDLLSYLEIVGIPPISNCVTTFSSHMNYYFPWKGGRKITNNFYPTITYFNDKNISKLYDIHDSEDKIYRVYDLYRGIINSRNERDVNDIHSKWLSQDCFDILDLEGITEKEDSLIGKSSIEYPEEYKNYLKRFFNSEFGYEKDFDLTRNSLLNIINYQMPGNERAKRYIEKELKVSYSDFEKLNIDERERLIEEKTGKKLNFSNINNISIDERINKILEYNNNPKENKTLIKKLNK